MSRCSAFEMSGLLLDHRIVILMFWAAFTGIRCLLVRLCMTECIRVTDVVALRW